jgi:hypothetical protein
MLENQETFSAIIVFLVLLSVVLLGIWLVPERCNTLVLKYENKMSPERLLKEIDTELWMFKYYTVVHFDEQVSIIGHNKKPDASNYYRAWEDYERLCYDVCSKAGWL